MSLLSRDDNVGLSCTKPEALSVSPETKSLFLKLSREGFESQHGAAILASNLQLERSRRTFRDATQPIHLSGDRSNTLPTTFLTAVCLKCS